MKCQHAEKLLLLQGSGELSGNKAELLNTHLQGCEACQQFQSMLIEAQTAFAPTEEPSATAVQNILREARLNAPEKRSARIAAWKPALAMAVSVMVGLGFFSLTLRPDKVGLELVVTETQLLDADDQVVDVMYNGLSEDDLAFHFLMTYEEG